MKLEIVRKKSRSAREKPKGVSSVLMKFNEIYHVTCSHVFLNRLDVRVFHVLL